MRRFLFLGLLVISFTSAKAQTPVEVFAGNGGVVHEFWFFKPFAEQSAFSWFSFTNVTIPYQRTPEGALQPQLLVSGFLTYDLAGGFGFSASSNIANSGVSYVLGGQYSLGIDSLSFLFVSAGADVRRNPNADVFLQFV
jgi:hypothetical protein